MFIRTMLSLGLLLASGLAFGATNQDASVTYQVRLANSKQVSDTGFTSSDTQYVESRCIGGTLEFTNACKSPGGRFSNGGLVYKATFTNAGTATIDATLLLFSETFTSPGDNVAWAMDDGLFRRIYLGRIDFPQSAQQEGGGDTYAEVVEVNRDYFCSSDSNIYGQLVKNNVGPVFIGGDTRSLSADTSVTLSIRPFIE